ncbi:MAG: hypothetical protein JEZ12_28035 [Desulfobacterium sp.]|nr:hypothetical protein [Desulfobacterium sp.]
MENCEILRNIKRMKLGETDRYEGPHGAVDVHKSTGGIVTVTPVSHTMAAIVQMISAIKPETACASPEDKTR